MPVPGADVDPAVAVAGMANFDAVPIGADQISLSCLAEPTFCGTASNASSLPLAPLDAES